MSGSIVLSSFLKALAVVNPVAFAVSSETLAKYRAMAGISNVQNCSRHRAELLMAALLYRPKTSAELARCWSANREYLSVLFVRALTDADYASVSIHQTVRGSELRRAIFEATLINIKSDKTLANYAAVLSERSGQDVRFLPSAEYSAEVATAFARLAVEKKQEQKRHGYDTAFKRWGYVPQVQYA
jgi:hypothetical protein